MKDPLVGCDQSSKPKKVILDARTYIFSLSQLKFDQIGGRDGWDSTRLVLVLMSVRSSHALPGLTWVCVSRTISWSTEPAPGSTSDSANLFPGKVASSTDCIVNYGTVESGHKMSVTWFKKT